MWGLSFKYTMAPRTHSIVPGTTMSLKNWENAPMVSTPPKRGAGGAPMVFKTAAKVNARPPRVRYPTILLSLTKRSTRRTATRVNVRTTSG